VTYGGAGGIRYLGQLDAALFRPQTGYYADSILTWPRGPRYRPTPCRDGSRLPAPRRRLHDVALQWREGREERMRDQLSVRLPRELNEAVGERAKRDSRRPSDVVRLALQQYLLGAASDGRRRADRVSEAGAVPAWGESESPNPERTIVLRDVPDDLYLALEERAAAERLSVADYVLDILARRRFLERLQALPRVELSVSAADLVREGRDSR